MTRTKTISAVFAAVLVVLAGGAAVTLAATNTGGTGPNAAIQDETTTVANETTTEIGETTTAEPVEETTAAEEPATGEALESFNVSNLTAPATANVSETITVTAEISNPNDQEATQPVEFRLDGNVVERQNVTLGAGESENVTFEVDTTGVEAGLHIHGILTQDRGQLAQITLLELTDVEETPTEAANETTTEEEVINETTTEEVVEETTTVEVVNETTTEEVIEETTTEEVIEETTTEPAVEEPERVDQLVFKVEQLEIDEWSFIIGDSETPDRTETVEGITIRDRTQRINLTALLMEDGTIEDAMVNETDQETITTPGTPEVPEDIETVRLVLRDITIENVTFIIELPEEDVLPEMPETPEVVETTTEPAVEETTTEPAVETTTEPAVETTTEPAVEETTTEPAVEETTTEPAVEETTTEPVVEETTTEPAVEETTTEPAVEETTTEPVVEETTTEPVVEETTTEPAVEETTTEPAVDEVGPGALSFDVSNLSAPASAQVGETVTVTANVTNPNDQEARQEVEFRLDGDLVERQNVTLDAGESQNVTFEVDTTGLEPGTYIHGVLTNEFGELAAITLEAAEETPTEVEETPTEIEETTTEIEETPTEVEETATEVEETATEVEETPTEIEETTTEVVNETTTEVVAEADAQANFSDQESNGTTVTIDSVTLAEGGFVTLHNESLLEGDALGSVVGTSEYLEAGTHENVTVELDEPLTESQMLIAMPHQDTNDNQQYDFVDTEGAEDGPYLSAEGEAVVDPGNVTVGTAEGTPTEEA